MGCLWGTFGVFVGLRSNYIMVTEWLGRGYWMTVTVVRSNGDGGKSHGADAVAISSLRLPRLAFPIG